MALSEAVKEAMSLRYFCKSICLEISETTLIYEDNQGCIAMVNNASCNSRSKHIDIAYHKTIEEIRNNQIILKYVSTIDQDADILTKSLPPQSYP